MAKNNYTKYDEDFKKSLVSRECEKKSVNLVPSMIE